MCTPDAVISLSSEDMQALFSGEMTAFNAYMQGKVTVEGDVRVAMKLQTVFERMKQPGLATRTAHAQNNMTIQGRNDVMIILNYQFIIFASVYVTSLMYK